MSVKKVLLQKSVSGTIYDIYPKTDASVVTYDKQGTATTVAAELASLATGLGSVVTQQDIDDAVEALENKIYGLQDGQSLATAFDTLKEISDYLNDHGSVVSGFTSDINALKTALGAPSKTNPATAATGLFADVEDLQSRVASLEAVGATKVEIGTTNGTIKIDGTQQTVYDDSALTNAIGTDSTTGTVKGRIKTLETTVGNASSGLVKKVADLETVGATKVESSTTNGNIKINGTETTVYDDTALAGRVTANENAIGSDTTSGTVKYRIKQLETVGATKVESSTTNGNVKINGTETTVYDDTAVTSRVTTLETTVGANDTAGLRKRIADLEAVGATKVEDGTTNGTIKVDGSTVTVYDGDASFINQDATHRFATDTEKAAWNTEKTQVVNALPGSPDPSVLYMVELS